MEKEFLIDKSLHTKKKGGRGGGGLSRDVIYFLT